MQQVIKQIFARQIKMHEENEDKDKAQKCLRVLKHYIDIQVIDKPQ